MTFLTALRSVDYQLPGSTQARLIYQGYAPIEPRTPLDSMHLRFFADFVDGSKMIGYVDKATWLNQAVPALQGIDWFSLDESLLPSLIAAHPFQLEFSQQHATVSQCRIIETFKDVERLSTLPRLITTAGPVIVESFSLAVSNGSDDSILESDLLMKLPIPVIIELGQSVLPLESITKINAGDILLIEKMTKRLSSHNRTLFKIELGQESIMIEEHSDEARNVEVTGLSGLSGPADGVEPTESKHDFRNLPVELSVILFEKILTLSELKALTPGEVLKLPADVMMNVEIRANQQRIACGELIQLTNGQLGVEIRTVWS